MRRSSVFLLAFGLTVVPAAMAQDAWTNTDPSCDSEIYSGTVAAVNKDQEQAEKDAQAANDYLKKIKEAPRNASGKLLSCVDVAWPDLPFSGVLPNIQEYIKKVGDKAVEEACNKARDEVRQVDSVFSKADMKIGQLQGIAGKATSAYNNVTSGTTGSVIPTSVTPTSSGDEGAFGGLIDLIKPPTRTPKP